MPDTGPIGTTDWKVLEQESGSDFSHAPRVKKAAKVKTVASRPFDDAEITGRAPITVVLTPKMVETLKWMFPSTRDDNISLKVVNAARALLAEVDIYDQSMHAYLRRVVIEAFERDFKKIDKRWQARTRQKDVSTTVQADEAL